MRRVLIYLIVGCVTNVVVAWACMFWSPTRSVTLPHISSPRIEPVLVHGPLGLAWWQTSTGFGIRISETLGVQLAGGDDTWVRGFVGPGAPTVFESGWPLLSMQSAVRPVHDRTTGRQLLRWELPPDEILRRGPQVADLPAGLRAYRSRRLPLCPLPLGFMVNSLLFSIISGVVVGAVRRMSRARRVNLRGFSVVPVDAGQAS